MGEALVAVDADGRITDFNAAAEELLDLPGPRSARPVRRRRWSTCAREDGTTMSPPAAAARCSSRGPDTGTVRLGRRPRGPGGRCRPARSGATTAR